MRVVLVGAHLAFLSTLSGCVSLNLKGVEDKPAGYIKTVAIDRRSVFVRRLRVAGVATANQTSLPVEVSLQRGQIRLTSSEFSKLPAATPVNYSIVTKYKPWLWPASYEKTIDGSFIVSAPPSLLSDESLCLEGTEIKNLRAALHPAPVSDAISLTVSTSGAAQVSVPIKDSPGVFAMRVSAHHVGRDVITLRTNRPHIESPSIKVTLFPEKVTPQDLRVAPTTQEDFNDPPVDDGGEELQPVVLLWSATKGVQSHAIEIYNARGERTYSAMIPGDNGRTVAWLVPGADYSWRVRALVPTCAGTVTATDFSTKMTFQHAEKSVAPKQVAAARR